MIEELLEGLERSIEDVKRKFYGVVTGTVTDVNDPFGLGRVKVRLPFLDAADPAPWARIASPSGGGFSGHYFVPEVDEEVLVAFEHGDTNVPYVLGSLWTATARPPAESPQSRVRAIRTPAGNQIVLGESPETVTIQTGPTPSLQVPAQASSTATYHTIELGSDGISALTAKKITLKVGTTSIVIDSSSITLEVSGSKIVVTGTGVEISAGGTLEMKSSGQCTVQGSVVKIN